MDLGAAPAPDETTILRFRHLLEEQDLCGMMLDAVNVHLESKGIKIATGTIVDATLIHAPSSTKNAKRERDPEMYQTRKGKQWCFGLKAHIGVDAKHLQARRKMIRLKVCYRISRMCGDAENRRPDGL